ncbi:MAG: MlaD family protein, partial [Pseudomonadota bacterium]
MIDQNRKYYYTGLFVILAVIILILFLVISDSIRNPNKTLYIESYFKGSVEGLSVGSPVKFNGVPIGRVTKIQFINSAYPALTKNMNNFNNFAYIYVLMAINSDNIPGPNNQLNFDTTVKNLVRQGLQVQISPDGLTGDSFISMSFQSKRNLQKVTVN